MMKTNPIRLLFFSAWLSVIITGGLAALAMIIDDRPGVITRETVLTLFNLCGVATAGLFIWSILFGKREQTLARLALVAICALLLAVIIGIGKMIK